MQLKNNQAYYGANDSYGNDKRAEYAVKEGCEALALQIDFSQYDNDNDGEVDLVFMYYAGKGEADGGGKNCIWPHQWSLSSGGIDLTLGGKKIDDYACSNEIVNLGALAGKMCGIGTASHEFGHAMGLPDFYDTNYEEDGEAGALYDFSLMCGGSYNNGGRTPPYLSTEERILLGWIEPSVEQELSESGQYQLRSVENDVAYKASCDTDGEYFLFETRGGKGWDAPLPTGLLIYHVDKSTTRKVGGYYTPYELWSNWHNSNSINAWGDHPCFYLIPSDEPRSLNLPGYSEYLKDESDIIFPGNANRTSYQPLDWDNEETAARISAITYASQTVSFTATVMKAKGVSGKVTDTSGKPLQGVTVQVDPVGQTTTSSNGRVRLVAARAESSSPYVTQTDSDGYYQIDLQDCDANEVKVTATLDGYIAKSQNITLKSKGNAVNFVLSKEGETQPTDLYKFDPSVEVTTIGTGDTSDDLMMSVRFTATDLSSYAGWYIKDVTILPACSADNLYIIIDFDSSRALTYNVPNPTFGQSTTISLAGENLRVPENGNMYIGYGMQGTEDGHPFGMAESRTFNDTYYDVLNLSSSDWTNLPSISGWYYDLILSVTVSDDDPETPPEDEDLIAKAGFSYIGVPDNFSFTAGEEFPLNLILGKNCNPKSIVWTLDGRTVSGESITLTSGDHTLHATLYYSDGSDETIELEMEVL